MTRPRADRGGPAASVRTSAVERVLILLLGGVGGSPSICRAATPGKLGKAPRRAERVCPAGASRRIEFPRCSKRGGGFWLESPCRRRAVPWASALHVAGRWEGLLRA